MSVSSEKPRRKVPGESGGMKVRRSAGSNERVHINRTRNFATNTCFIENTRDEYRPPITHRDQAERSIATARGAISRRRRVPPRRYTLFTLHSMHGTCGNFRILPTIKYCTSDTETVCLIYSLLHTLSLPLSLSLPLTFSISSVSFSLSHTSKHTYTLTLTHNLPISPQSIFLSPD